MEWDGRNRRAHNAEDCPQEKRLERIEMIMDGLVKQLAASNETLVAIRELLNGKIEKYDGHVEAGDRWRRDMFSILVTACLAGFSTTLGFGIWVGSLSNKLDNGKEQRIILEQKVHRLEMLNPYNVDKEK